MVAGARGLAIDAAAQDVRTSLEGLSHGDQVGVLVGVLAALGKHSGNVPVFLALVQATVRERLGVA